MKIGARIFTLEEANALLPEIDSHLSRLADKKEAYARRHDELLMHHFRAVEEVLLGAEKDGRGDLALDVISRYAGP